MVGCAKVFSSAGRACFAETAGGTPAAPDRRDACPTGDSCAGLCKEFPGEEDYGAAFRCISDGPFANGPYESNSQSGESNAKSLIVFAKISIEGDWLIGR